MFKKQKISLVGAQPLQNMLRYRLERRPTFGNTTTRQSKLLFKPFHLDDVRLSCVLNAVLDCFDRFIVYHLPLEDKKQSFHCHFDARIVRVAPVKPSVLVQRETGLRSWNNAQKVSMTRDTGLEYLHIRSSIDATIFCSDLHQGGGPVTRSPSHSHL